MRDLQKQIRDLEEENEILKPANVFSCSTNNLHWREGYG